MEDGGESTNGTCECIHGTFNPDFTNNENYCLNSLDVSSYSGNPKIERSSSHTHHIVAGVSISLVLVFIVTGLFYTCNKLHVYQYFSHIRVRRTHCRPFYEDVMLGNDDPPII